MTFDEEISALATMVVRDFSAANKKLTTAESCTGGLIAGSITSVSGSSAVFDRGFVTYSNQAKHDLLGVSTETLNQQGAVSGECAAQMAMGALAAAQCDASVAVTGIAGPGGGSAEKPVGLVYIAVATSDEEGAFVEKFEFGNLDRDEIRAATIRESLEMLLGYAIEDTEKSAEN